MEGNLLLWVGFNVFILAMLAVDLLVFHRRPHEESLREAIVWSVIWTIVALLFNLGIYFLRGSAPALDFLTGYIIERSLSIDNLFVFVLVFSYFGVSAAYQHKVLFWGIIGALLMRFAFIFAGVALIERFHFVIYLFGGILIFSGIKMFTNQQVEIHPEKNIVIRMFRRFMPVTPTHEGDRFFVKRDGRTFATPLFVVLLLVETTDLVFAVDSIPAVLAITTDHFIVYSSNVFAILGMRALYFALAGVMKMFRYLHYGLSAILVFVGAKMVASDVIHITTPIALGVVAIILVISVVASILHPRPVETPPA
jgi:tellurite resistance protein TerC